VEELPSLLEELFFLQERAKMKMDKINRGVTFMYGFFGTAI
jgi:hypothetical protein